MPFGWTGQILRIDLSSGKWWTENTEAYTRLFIGGKGINVKVLYDEIGPTVGPFDPANRVCLGPGVMAGTMAPSHSRMKITAVSPNGFLQNSGVGGHLPAEIRKAGYDNVIIQGKSENPAYVYIDNDRVEIRDATHLWGCNTQETQQAIKQELGDWVKAACIGPAGENLVSSGCIVTGKGSAAGRGGFGAVLGSKNLKGIAVRGTGQVRIANPSEFLAACTEAHLFLPESSRFMKMQGKEGHGDKYTLAWTVDAGIAPLGNWEVTNASWDRIGEYGGAEEFYKEHATSPQYGCDGCPVHHFHIFDIPGRCRGTTKCAQWNSFSTPVWINDRKVIVQANTLCQDYGLDSTATGNAVAFLMELFHRGIISEKDTDGIPMTRGDEKAVFAAIEKIGKQEGFGRLFREGVSGAALEIGKDAEECAMVVNGQETELVEFRAFKAWALVAAVNDGTVSHGEPLLELTWSEDKEDTEKLGQELFGSRQAVVPTSYEKKGLHVWDEENINTAGDLTGTCRWIIPWGVTRKLDMPAKLLSLATGQDINVEDLLRAAERTLTLERAFRVRKGARRSTLPERLFTTAVQDGTYKGEKLDKEKFERMLDEYYGVRGWDRNGIPTQETFLKFGLDAEWETLNRELGKE
jgi:aldehyde:ferredoxin oxidoreductase